MKTSIVEHENQRYQLDKATWTHWPHAVVTRAPARGLNWQLFVTPELLEQFTASLEGVLLSELPSDTGEIERVSALQTLDYFTCSIDEAIQRIAEDSEDAGDLVVLLEQWFFLKKL